ncbi:MAG: hypothetical protein Q4A01_09635 [Coriobacteriales bacterium]|nr:hypothetical protein [Coriobacteriales bacterium]
MGEVSRTELEAMLVRHYAAQPVAVNPKEVDDVVRAMLAEDARMGKVRHQNMGFAAFVAAQVGFVPAWTWVAQVAIVAVMCVVAFAGGDVGATKITVGVLSAATVLVGIPTIHTSKLHGVAELEYSCPNNAASVMVARLIVLGCSSALVVLLMVAMTAAFLDLGAFAVALWATPPFFCSCAGCLFALRRAVPSTATALCVFWTVSCSAALMVLSGIFPEMYAEASLAVWAGAAALALAWLVREVAITLHSVREGLDAFSPYMAKTYN